MAQNLKLKFIRYTILFLELFIEINFILDVDQRFVYLVMILSGYRWLIFCLPQT